MTSATTAQHETAGVTTVVAGPGILQHDRVSAAWAAFSAARTSEDFCRTWLALQCSMVPDVHAALLLLRDDASQSVVVKNQLPQFLNRLTNDRR